MPPTRRSARAPSGTSPYQTTNANISRTNSVSSSASIARQSGQGLRLTVKTNPSKLRQATSGSAANSSIPPNPYADGSESDATPQPASKRTARSTRNPRTVVEKDTSDDEDEDEDEIMVDQGADAEEEEDEEEEDEEDEEEEEEEEEEEDEEEPQADVDEELLANEDSEADAEESEDELQQDHVPSPVMKRQSQIGQIKPNVTITAPPEEALKSVEDKEMEDEEEDEELSELESGDERDVGLEGDVDDEEDIDSDSDSDGSRAGTPDLSKLTRRQRGYFEEDANLMALSNEAQKKKHLTAEEHAMRRAEMARRRKNLSEKRNEEEKQDTINKLLKKPAPKRRTRAEIIAQQQADAMSGTPGWEEGDEERADPLFTRWINTREGSRLGVPDEWLDAPVGEIFASSNGRMVQEVA